MTEQNQLPPATDEQPQYRSLQAIRSRKQQLRKQLQKDDAEMRKLWHSLFSKQEPATKGTRITGLMSTGAGVVDGLLLGWKLYRKYKGFRRR